MLKGILSPSLWESVCSSKRYASVWRLMRPKPRPYRRRLYEEALKGDYPKDFQIEYERLKENDPYLFFPESPVGENAVSTKRFLKNKIL